MKKLYKLLGIIAIMAVIEIGLAGCKDPNSGGGSGGCPNPNKTCWYRSDTDKSFCGEASCELAYDFNARCNCGN
jgi:hypothetical protein